ncbi:MAG TPA: DinB family protein [Thermomicrobiales bacterium]|jgi:hypothetical protein
MVAQTEALVFWRYIASSLDRLVACLNDLNAEGLNWRPPAPDANSLYVLATHTLGNAEENILQVLCGQAVGRDRAGEFAALGVTPAVVLARWQELRALLGEALTQLPPAGLGATYTHPRRGTLTGREILIVVARHAAEHLGQAELTRDLLQTARES